MNIVTYNCSEIIASKPKHPKFELERFRNFLYDPILKKGLDNVQIDEVKVILDLLRGFIRRTIDLNDLE